MLETNAVVVQVNGPRAMVRADMSGGCGHCNGKGCGASKLSSLFCSKPRQFEVRNGIDAAVGDRVIVTVEDGAIIRGVGQAYLIPMIMLIAGATLGGNWNQSPTTGDMGSALGALAGLIVGFAIARWLSGRQQLGRYQPSISRFSGEQRPD